MKKSILRRKLLYKVRKSLRLGNIKYNFDNMDFYRNYKEYSYHKKVKLNASGLEYTTWRLKGTEGKWHKMSWLMNSRFLDWNKKQAELYMTGGGSEKT